MHLLYLHLQSTFMASEYLEFKFRDFDQSPDFFLWQVFQQWQKQKAKVLSILELTSSQMTVLTSIYWLKQNEKSTIQVAISDCSHMDKMTTSQVLRKLEKKGFIVRLEHPTDTRAKTVELTKHGLSVVVKALKLVDESNQEYFSILDETQNEFVNILKNLLKSNK